MLLPQVLESRYDDGVTSAVYTYDAIGRKLTETVDYGPFTLGHAYSYYRNGLKASFTDPEGETARYYYDDANRLSDIDLPDGRRITYAEYQWNRPTLVNYPAGLTTRYDYDPLQRVSRILSQGPLGNTLMDYRYTRSLAGKILTMDTEHGLYTYQYDLMDRLTYADNPNLSDERYAYDSVGNRLTSAEVAGAWVYDENNRLLRYGDQLIEYDDNGNMVERGSAEDRESLRYGAKNRLVSIGRVSDAFFSQFLYDPFGRRLKKTVNGSETYFSYNQEGLVGSYDATGRLDQNRLFAPDSVWSANTVSQSSGGTPYWSLNDHIGTPKSYVDSSGSPRWSAMYQSFGARTIGSATIRNPLGFPGQYVDDESGLHYNFARYYEPRTGRYITIDPLGIKDPSSIYGYADQNPLINFDPRGKCSLALDNFPWYGNWGGPGRAAGRNCNPEADLDLADFQFPAKDARDQCYKDHDRCIWLLHYLKKRQHSCEDPDLYGCHVGLAYCLAGLPHGGPRPSPPEELGFFLNVPRLFGY